MHSGYVRLVTGSNKWTYALSSGVCPDRRRARRTESARLEVTMLSAFQEKLSYTTAVRGLLGGESVMMRRIRAFVEATEMGRSGVSVVAAAALRVHP